MYFEVTNVLGKSFRVFFFFSFKLGPKFSTYMLVLIYFDIIVFCVLTYFCPYVNISFQPNIFLKYVSTFALMGKEGDELGGMKDGSHCNPLATVMASSLLMQPL